MARLGRRQGTLRLSPGLSPLSPAAVSLFRGRLLGAIFCLSFCLALLECFSVCRGDSEAALQVGFAETDITPRLNADEPVWLAGYHPGRQATGIHDKLYARAVALSDGDIKLALVSVDLIGLQYPVVQRIRAELPQFQYVAVASTHNHEGPDVIGVWGESYLHRGVDDRYIDFIVRQVVAAACQAEQAFRAVSASYGTAEDSTLLQDTRLPEVKDGVLRVLRFTADSDGATAGLLVQWNCHPESLGADNTLITADFPAWTIERLSSQYGCPVVYFTGAIGGLMAPPSERLRGPDGNWLSEGDFEFARQYGYAVAELTHQACEDAVAIRLTPFRVVAARTGVPMTNELYRLARLLGVLRRDAFVWHEDDRSLGAKIESARSEEPAALETEVAYLRLGALHMALLPGELYPELVEGKVEDPPQADVDHPDAPIEPVLTSILPSSQWMLLGLANDEIGYIIPRRQWDRSPPYAYDRSGPQYGEINSCSPAVADVVMRALRQCVTESLEP